MLKYVKNFVKNILVIVPRWWYGSFGINSKIERPYISIANRKNIFIGNSVYIRKNARIAAICTWRGNHYSPIIQIDDNVTIEQGVHITCAGFVHIQQGCLITPYCEITDINHEYTNPELSVAMQGIKASKTIIGENSFLGTGVKVMAGVTIGRHCVIGANAVVTTDIPDYSVAVGVPAKVIKKYDFESREWKKVENV